MSEPNVVTVPIVPSSSRVVGIAQYRPYNSEPITPTFPVWVSECEHYPMSPEEVIALFNKIFMNS